MCLLSQCVFSSIVYISTVPINNPIEEYETALGGLFRQIQIPPGQIFGHSVSVIDSNRRDFQISTEFPPTSVPTTTESGSESGAVFAACFDLRGMLLFSSPFDADIQSRGMHLYRNKCYLSSFGNHAVALDSIGGLIGSSLSYLLVQAPSLASSSNSFGIRSHYLPKFIFQSNYYPAKPFQHLHVHAEDDVVNVGTQNTFAKTTGDTPDPTTNHPIIITHLREYLSFKQRHNARCGDVRSKGNGSLKTVILFDLDTEAGVYNPGFEYLLSLGSCDCDCDCGGNGDCSSSAATQSAGCSIHIIFLDPFLANIYQHASSVTSASSDGRSDNSSPASHEHPWYNDSSNIYAADIERLVRGTHCSSASSPSSPASSPSVSVSVSLATLSSRLLIIELIKNASVVIVFSSGSSSGGGVRSVTVQNEFDVSFSDQDQDQGEGEASTDMSIPGLLFSSINITTSNLNDESGDSGSANDAAMQHRRPIVIVFVESVAHFRPPFNFVVDLLLVS